MTRFFADSKYFYASLFTCSVTHNCQYLHNKNYFIFFSLKNISQMSVYFTLLFWLYFFVWHLFIYFSFLLHFTKNSVTIVATNRRRTLPKQKLFESNLRVTSKRIAKMLKIRFGVETIFFAFSFSVFFCLRWTLSQAFHRSFWSFWFSFVALCGAYHRSVSVHQYRNSKEEKKKKKTAEKQNNASQRASG